jgi:hypothetical protein
MSIDVISRTMRRFSIADFHDIPLSFCSLVEEERRFQGYIEKAAIVASVQHNRAKPTR